MGICYLIGAGRLYDTFSVREGDMVIAADGGYDSLPHGVSCDMLIGDLDSITGLPSSILCKRHPVEKDDTDMMLAYREGASRGYTEFVVYGGTGSLDDHTFANLSLLLYAREHGHKMTLVGEFTNAIVIKNESVTLQSAPDKRLSVFAIGGEAEGVKIIGAKYEVVAGITLTPDFPLGVSNSFTGHDAEISVEHGALLIFSER